MQPPAQSPPIDRTYSRPVVGKKGKPREPAESGTAAAKIGGNYLIELTVFHVRRGRAGR